MHISEKHQGLSLCKCSWVNRNAAGSYARFSSANFKATPQIPWLLIFTRTTTCHLMLSDYSSRYLTCSSCVSYCAAVRINYAICIAVHINSQLTISHSTQNGSPSRQEALHTVRIVCTGRAGNSLHCCLVAARSSLLQHCKVLSLPV